MRRREFLATSTLPFVIDARAPSAPDLDFASAAEAADAIRSKRVSSVELTRRVFDRIDRYDPGLGAFVYQTREEALADAAKADAALAGGRSLGPLHGVPVHVKESFGVKGRPCTWGLEAFRSSQAPRDSEPVARLRAAGAVLVGATNVPENLNDCQSYNSFYGTTNNPWDRTRTPGGSSGGAAAALAAGIGYLTVGSDIGGSIRCPAHFCGVYGHKPTLDLVCELGQLPGGQWQAPGFSTLLAVAGPMARSAGDLLSALQILGGPAAWDRKAWSWQLPPSRGRALRDFRVGYVLDDPIAPVTAETKAVLEPVVAVLERAGARLKPGWPSTVQPPALLDNYMFHLMAFLESVAAGPEREAIRKRPVEAAPSQRTFMDWQQQNLLRLDFRARWQAYFEEVDVFLSPVAFTPAIPHDHSLPQSDRRIPTSSGPRAYWDILRWIAHPTLTGCPATSAPVGRTREGLPVGIQVMGPFWEDATPIVFAELLAREIGGFTPPPGYAG